MVGARSAVRNAFVDMFAGTVVALRVSGPARRPVPVMRYLAFFAGSLTVAAPASQI